MPEELIFDKNNKLTYHLMANDSGVYLNNKKIAERRYVKDGIRYGFLASKRTKINASNLIKKRHEIHGNRYRHFTKKVGNIYLVYVGSNNR